MSYYYCYLLRSLNEKSKGTAYIGFSTTPAQRLRQHNGEIAAGAKKTSIKMPWKHVIIVGGFPNKIVGLQFEWQWQNPYSSRISSKLLNDPDKPQPERKIDGYSRKGIDRRNHGGYKNKITILCALLQHPLWAQLNLTVYIVDDDMRKIIYKLLSDSKLPKNITLCNITPAEVGSLKSTEKGDDYRKEFLTFLQSKAISNPQIRDSNNVSIQFLDIYCEHCSEAILHEDCIWKCIQCECIFHVNCTALYALDQKLQSPITTNSPNHLQSTTTNVLTNRGNSGSTAKKPRRKSIKVVPNQTPIIGMIERSFPGNKHLNSSSSNRVEDNEDEIVADEEEEEEGNEEGETIYSTAFGMIPRFGKCMNCQKEWPWTSLIQRFMVHVNKLRLSMRMARK